MKRSGGSEDTDAVEPGPAGASGTDGASAPVRNGHPRGEPPSEETAGRIALLAERVGADASAFAIRRMYREDRSPLSRVCVLGSANTGKSHLVNALVGSPCVPVSLAPGPEDPLLVRASGTGPEPRTRSSLRTLYLEGPAGDWLRETDLEVLDTPGWELWRTGTEDPVGGNPRIDPVHLLADCDAVIVATDAIRALTASERERIATLVSVPYAMPLVLLVTRLDEVGENAGLVMRRVRNLMAGIAPEAFVLPGPGKPADTDRVLRCRSVLADTTGADRRDTVRDRRRLDLLKDTCDQVARAAEEALTSIEWSEREKSRAAEVLHNAHSGAQFRWFTLAAELVSRREALLSRLESEAERRYIEHSAELARRLSARPPSEEPETFIRLAAVPETRVALSGFRDWIISEARTALAKDSTWLRRSLAQHHPGEEFLRSLTDIRTTPLSLRVSLPHEAVEASREEADAALRQEGSRIADLLSTTLPKVLAPVADESLAALADGLSSGVSAGLAAKDRGERRNRTIRDLDLVVSSAFTNQVDRVTSQVEQAYTRLRDRHRERDEQWWRMRLRGLTAPSESVGHWRSLLTTARDLRQELAPTDPAEPPRTER